MQFYLGAHQPAWLTKATVPLFVSHRRLVGRRNLSRLRARSSWALDSGGFSELSFYGQWRTGPFEYVQWVKGYDLEIGRLDWAAPQDWMCEPWILANTGLSVREHQERIVENFVQLGEMCARWDGKLRPVDQASCPFMPVLQGWTVEDYWRCVDLYAQAGVRLADYPLVGLGSVCRRQNTGEIEAIVRSLGAVLPLNGFGVKTDGLNRYGDWPDSAALSPHPPTPSTARGSPPRRATPSSLSCPPAQVSVFAVGAQDDSGSAPLAPDDRPAGAPDIPVPSGAAGSAPPPDLPAPVVGSVTSTDTAFSFCTCLTLSSVSSATCAIGTPSVRIRTIASPIFASAASIALTAPSRSSCAR